MKNYCYEEIREWLCDMLKECACPSDIDRTFSCTGHTCEKCAALMLDEYERLILSGHNSTAPKKPHDFTAEKEAWVKKMMDEFSNTNSNWGCDICVNRILVFKVGQSGVLKTGIARCNPTDTFDTDTGLALAYARAQKYEIPFYMFL